MYTVDQLAEELNLSISSIHRRIRNLGLVPKTYVGGKQYSFDDLNLMRMNNVKIIYYPLKTTETFWIFESKLNTMEL